MPAKGESPYPLKGDIETLTYQFPDFSTKHFE